MLEPEEAWTHPHNVARGTFVDVEGVVQPSPQPRFSRTPARIDGPPPVPGEHTQAALADWGVPPATITAWEHDGVVRQDRTDQERGSR